MSRTGAFLVGIWVLAATACGSQSDSTQATTQRQVAADSNSGGDDTLAGARGLFSETVNDSVDATVGDNTDIKYIDIDGRGVLNVRVRFLQPQQFAGVVTLMNDFGDVLAERPYTAGVSEVLIEDFSVLPGRYYVRIHASEGRSEYAIRRDFDRDPNYLSQDDMSWRDSQIAEARRLIDAGEWQAAREILRGLKNRFPENNEIDRLFTQVSQEVDRAEAAAITREEEERARRSSRRSTRRTNETQTERPPRTETPPPGDGSSSTTTTPPPAEEPSASSVRATIISLRDRGAGSGTTIILTGCGSSSGLSEGAEGRISGTSLRVRITRITGGNSCEAETSGTPGQIGSAGHVSF
jgi:hypothetical protein